MACIENVLGGHAPSPIVVAVDKNGNRELRHDMPLQCPNSIPKEDGEPWGHPHIQLRPPINVLTNLAREQLERPSQRTGSCIPVDSSRALRHQYGPPPAVAEESLATAEVNSSEGLAGWRQKGQDSIVSQEVSGSPPRLLVGGTRVSTGGTERGGNNARLDLTLPRGKGFFSPRGPQVRGSPHLPSLRSGILMEVPPGNTRMYSKGRLAHVSFPLRGPRHPVDNWPRPIPLSSGSPGLPSCSIAHCLIPPIPPSFNPFLAMPIAFAAPPMFGPLLPSHFAHFHSGVMPAPVASKREHN
ncbi:PREDICTED: proline-rich protein 32 [Propithecus coquereli]|uniref:Proline rich 32 n=1 Tax=Propithecus coquereli TaxID=379532 RepID=A0A2K6GG33_PROCO|nr:PREDICTED: proline-rich protein 32 [Propithecus coquereli]